MRAAMAGVARRRGSPFLLAAAMVLTVAAVAFLLTLTEPRRAEQRPAGEPLGGKSVDRLGAALDDGAQPQLRIGDTIALFALPQADARTWTERPAPKVSAPDRRPAAPLSSSVPRMVSAESGKPRAAPALPPSRPAIAAAAPAAAVAATGPEEARMPAELFGLKLPGTERVPTREELARTARNLGDKAASAGGRAVDAVSGTAARIGDSIAEFGSTVAEKVGLR